MDYLVVTGMALIYLLVIWAYGRALGAGQPLNAYKRRGLRYAFVFVLGGVYLMVIVHDLRWPEELLWPIIGTWGVVVGLVAWWRYRRRRTSEPSPDRTQEES